MAMLGKQVCRLLQRPNSLISWVLKVKYFLHSSVWEADATPQSSYTWKSILWGRNLVAKGIRWRVGDGTSISVHHSRWLPVPWKFTVSSPKVLPLHSKVSDLLHNNRSWNEGLIRPSFLEYEANIILSLQRPLIPVPDAYCWHFEIKVPTQLDRVIGWECVIWLLESPSTSTNAVFGWWNSLWSLCIPQKVKIFWWKIAHDLIPTSWNMRIHHVPCVLTCALCVNGRETTLHALFTCLFIKLISKKSQWAQCISVAKAGTMLELAVWARNQWDRDDFELFTMTIWEIWNIRNKWKHNELFNLKGIELQVLETYLEGFRRCRRGVMPSTFDTQDGDRNWLPPGLGFLRLDVDASLSSIDGSFGIGGVIRDSRGEVLIASCWPKVKAASVGQAELIVILGGLQHAEPQQLKDIQVCSDASSDISKLRAETPPSNEDRFVLDEIKICSHVVNVISSQFVYRSCNLMAHSLARYALNLSDPVFWNACNGPSWFSNLVHADVAA